MRKMSVVEEIVYNAINQAAGIGASYEELTTNEATYFATLDKVKDQATCALKELILSKLPKKKENLWYQASGQDFQSQEDAYKDGKCNGYNSALSEVKRELEGVFNSKES